MHILTLTWEYPPKSVGGLAQHVFDLSHALQDEGHHVTIITTGDDNLPEYEKDGNIIIHRVRPFPLVGNDFLTWVFQLNFALLEKSIEIIRSQEKFDVLHAHDWLVAFTARTLKFGMRIPLVATIHATEYGRNQGLHNELQRYISDVEWWLIYEAWKVIVCSNYMKNEAENIFQCPYDKLKIIPNGADEGNFNSLPDDFKRHKYASDEEKIVFFVGRVVHEKGIHILIEAMPKIIHHYPKVKFIIAGKGPILEYLKSKALLLGVAEKCFFTGYIDDKMRNAFYKNASVAVFPSIYEPFGIVALEAMAGRVPVVVSDVGGLSEIVNHGIDGLKAIRDNAGSLADCILSILQNDELADYLVKNASSRVKNEFSWKKIAKSTIDVYENVINEAENFVIPYLKTNIEGEHYESNNHGRWGRFKA